jgi:hypothetical protein
MKSKFKSILTLLPIYMLSVGSVFAESGDVVIGIEDCSLFDGNGFIQRNVGTGITVSAQSANNNTIHTCSADVTPPDSGHSAIFNIDNATVNGFPARCGLKGTAFVTDDWHQVVSANGKAKLVCHFKN